jgi:hypothetical protein
MLDWIASLRRSSPGQQFARQISTQGYALLPNYWSPAECRAATEALDEYYAREGAAVNHRGDSDERIFGAEYVDPRIREFKHSALCLETARAFMRNRQQCLFTMANRLQKRDERPARSGGSWHRDRPKSQFKALLYLVDVTKEMGPFSLLPRSGVTAKGYAGEIRSSAFEFQRTRWADEEIEPFLALARERLQVFVAPAGTLILFDSSQIHSGQPNTSGTRYALTNYYYLGHEMTAAKAQEKWSPLAGPVDPAA